MVSGELCVIVPAATAAFHAAITVGSVCTGAPCEVLPAPATSVPERKQLLRAAICEVAVTIHAGTRIADLTIIWQGGATTDLAMAMKYNPDLKIMLNAGYFDLATPFYEGVYEMQHLAIPAKLQNNIEYQFYESGHMVYAHEASLKVLHDSVAAFILKTENAKAK